MDDPVFIGFDGHNECYLVKMAKYGTIRLCYNAGKWSHRGNITLAGDIKCQLTNWRQQEFEKICEAKSHEHLPVAMSIRTMGLSIYSDLINVIAGYLIAIYPCALPIPRNDFYRTHNPELESLYHCATGIGGTECWFVTLNHTTQTFNFSIGEWYIVTTEGTYKKINNKRMSITLDTRRKQIFEMPMRPV